MKKIIALFVGVLIIYGCLYTLDVSWTTFLTNIQRIKIFDLFIFALLHFIVIFVGMIRWELIVSSSLPEISWPKHFLRLSYLAAFISSLLIPNIGAMGTKALMIKNGGNTTWKNAAIIVFIEQILNLAIPGILLLPGVILLFNIEPVILNILFCLLGIVFVLVILYNARSYVCLAISAFIINIQMTIARISIKPREIADKNDLYESMAQYLDQKNFALILVYSIAVYLAPIIRYYLTIKAMDVDIHPLLFIIAYPVIHAIILFSITPNSLGILEVGWIVVLMFLGVDKEVSATISIVLRIIDQILLAVTSVVVYLYILISGVSISSLCMQNKPDPEQKKCP
ncbi:MAG: flippase-like domain-containing protein [Magnetococcales bacterium]|nr:flippase-like domain-containing protein [Magnetococcales bacterium]